MSHLLRPCISAAVYCAEGRGLGDYGADNREAARQVIAQHRSAPAALVGELDLLLAFVEAGTGFIRKHGCVVEAFYDDLSQEPEAMAP